MLFKKRALSDALSTQEAELRHEVPRLDPDTVLRAGVAATVDRLVEKYHVSAPVLQEDHISVSQHEVDIDLRGDPLTIHLPGMSPTVRGVEVSYHVPYEGDAGFFDCYPNPHTLGPTPVAEISPRELTIRYRVRQLDAEELKRRFAGDLATIKAHLESLGREADTFTQRLRPMAQQLVETRHDAILRDRNTVASLGYPLHERANVPRTYAVTKREKAPLPPPRTREPFTPEPALDLETYDKVLSIVQNMVVVMERSPHAFSHMREEDLRQHFLVQLNGTFEGDASGETFNYEGRTDILIRANGRNIFIAECKFWDGPASLSGAIDQLLSYSSWRDTKTAILLFSRGRNFSDILAKIPSTVQAHPHFRRQMDYQHETGYRCALHHKEDPERELTLTVLAFTIPSADAT
jgi:hypothetical protein